MTTRLTVTLDDYTAAAVVEAATEAGQSVSDWMGRAARRRLLAEDAAAVAAWQAARPEETAAQYRDTEAEQIALDKARAQSGNAA